MTRALVALLLVAAAPAGLESQVRDTLAAAGAGPRYGLLVTDADGREVIALDPDGRYVPASNAKLLVTAAAFASPPLGPAGAAVRLDGRDVVLIGRGDAALSSAPDCVVDCLATLADAVAARTRRVRDVIGDDSAFPDQRWPPGMSWNNIPTRSGTAASALTLDDNELRVTVTPAAPGKPPTIAAPAYLTIDNRAVTAATGPVTLTHDRLPGERRVRIVGAIPVGAPLMLRLGVDDPADHAAWRFRALLEARGVHIDGAVRTRHRPPGPSDDPKQRGNAPAPRPPSPPVLATLAAPPPDIARINKTSQNLHAELLLRRLGAVAGSGSLADGVAAVSRTMAAAGAPRHAWDLADGSGMSTYDRVSPRAMTALLRWAARQPWGDAWRATLPIAAVDGTLAKRFVGTPLAGRLSAKTGTLSGTTALAGYMTAASGRTLVFAAYAGDVPEDVDAAAAIDRALVLIAAAR